MRWGWLWKGFSLARLRHIAQNRSGITTASPRTKTASLILIRYFDTGLGKRASYLLEARKRGEKNPQKVPRTSAATLRLVRYNHWLPRCDISRLKLRSQGRAVSLELAARWCIGYASGE